MLPYTLIEQLISNWYTIIEQSITILLTSVCRLRWLFDLDSKKYIVYSITYYHTYTYSNNVSWCSWKSLCVFLTFLSVPVCPTVSPECKITLQDRWFTLSKKPFSISAVYQYMNEVHYNYNIIMVLRICI